MRTCLLAGLILFAARADAENRWHWDDRFSDAEQVALSEWISDAEQVALSEWISHTTAAMDALFGPVPAIFDVHFHRRDEAREPVPWGQTNKGGGRHVHFFVDPAYPSAAFRADWTAPHELIHLLFPYLGEDSRWFAEGVASYLQYQVMFADGVLDWPQAIARYDERFAAARSAAAGTASVVERSRGDLKGRWLPVYWGGAAFFLEADRRLFLQRSLRLTDVVARYSACCYRPWGVDADDMIRRFDVLSDSHAFSEAYAATVKAPGFPPTADALAWLAKHPPPLHRESAD